MKKILLFLTLCFANQCMAQSLDLQIMGNAGRQFVTGSASMAYTIGEPLTATLIGQNGIATQGFHQGTISVTSVREELQGLELTVYPNPTADRLEINCSVANAQWQLHTFEGKALTSGLLYQGSNVIDVTGLSQATYLLTVSLTTHQSNTYRIVKIQ